MVNLRKSGDVKNVGGVSYYGVILMAAFFPSVAFFAPRAAGLVVPLFTLIVVGETIYRRRHLSDLGSSYWRYIAAILFLCLLSVFWSPDFSIGSERFFKLALFLPLGTALLLMIARDAVAVDRGFYCAVSLGIFVSVCLLGFHVLTGGGVYGLLNPTEAEHTVLDAANRPAVVLVLCFSAGIVALQKISRPQLAVPLGFILVVILLFSTSQSALFGLGVWLLTCLAFALAPMLSRQLLVWGGAMFIIVQPALVIGFQQLDVERSVDYEPGSVGARLDIWYAVSRKILESPIYGHGLEAARSITDWSVEFVYYQGNSMLHPHNGILQIWLEFGVIGALGAAFCWVLGSSRVLRLSGKTTPAVASLLATSLFVLTVSHGLWQSWWLWSLFGVAALTTLAVQGKTPCLRGKAPKHRSGRAP